MSYDVRRLWIHKSEKAKEEWAGLLRQAGIRPEETVSYTVGLYDGEKLIATGSLHQNVLKCIAVCKSYTGGAAVSQLVSHLINEVYDAGYSGCFVYTKPASAASFVHMGFKEVARVPEQLVLLEKDSSGIDAFLDRLRRSRIDGEKVAGIVMNANPFTKGHRYLVEKASRENDVVHLFVLSEDLSAFPSAVRMQLVREGTRDLSNVHIHETGDYLVSAKTFPSYFLKEDVDVTEVQAKLDAILFKERIAPALGIHRRYVGSEPLSFATNIYNAALQSVFGEEPELIIVPRIERDGEVVSASRVRQLIRENRIAETEALLPPSTFQFLQRPEAEKIINRIQNQSK